jgi:hypothetical protein
VPKIEMREEEKLKEIIEEINGIKIIATGK